MIGLRDDAIYRNMMEQARDIILVVDTCGNILIANTAAINAYGYSRDELRSMRINELRSPETRNAVDAQLRIAQQEGILFRTVHMRWNGESFPVEVSSRRIRLSEKEAVISVVRDITATVAMETAIKKSEEKYRLLNEELTAANEELIASEEELRQQFDELTAREEAIDRQNIVLSSLHETALQLMEKPKLNDVLKFIVFSATELLGTPHGVIRLVDEEKGIFCNEIGLGHYTQHAGRDIKLTEGLSGQVYKTGKIIIVNDYSNWANRLLDPFFDQVHGIAYVPLKAGDKVIGILGVEFLDPQRRFSDQDISFLSRFADLASIALKNAQLLSTLEKSEKELRKRNEELAAAHEELLASDEELKQQFNELMAIGDKIRQQNIVLTSVHETAMSLMNRLELDEVLKTIISSAARLMGTPDSYINLVDEKEKIFVRKVAIGRFAQDMTRQTAVMEGLLGQAYITAQIAVVDDYRTWELRLPDPVFDDLHCCVVVPLKVEERVIGAFGLAFTQPGRTLADHEYSLLQRFSDMASLALDNATLVASYKNELQERRQAEKTIKTSEAKYRAIFEAANDGIYIHDIETGKILDVNEKACAMHGYTREEILSGDLGVLGTGESPFTENEARQWLGHVVAGRAQLFEWQNRHKAGHCIWMEVNLQRARIGNEDRILAIVRDISERKAHEHAIRRMAYHDSLTGLPNRAYLKEHLDQELEKSRRGEAAGTVLFVDLDNLKTINDTFGHSYGDGVIIKAGAYIFAEAGEGAFVARIGGDEFIVVLPGEADREKVKKIADGMVKLLERDYDIGDAGAYLSGSVGIALYPEDGDTAEDILKNADLALYAAKGSGKNTWRFYESSMQRNAYYDMLLKQGLREAISRNELSLHYQPLVSTHTSGVVSFEALLRWNSAELGPVPPGRFIPLAEESDTIQIIGRWVIWEACRFACRLCDLGKGYIRVSVNVSPRQLAADDFVPFIRDAINAVGIKPNQLEFEITENILITSMKESSQKLKDLRELGVHLSLDDFGSGYCSLTYLKKLPVETLKIDKSFIDDIEYDEDQLRFVNSIINMAHVQRLNVVAEGVETQEQLNRLMQCRCDLAQGYIFSRPMPEREAVIFLAGSEAI